MPLQSFGLSSLIVSDEMLRMNDAPVEDQRCFVLRLALVRCSMRFQMPGRVLALSPARGRRASGRQGFLIGEVGKVEALPPVLAWMPFYVNSSMPCDQNIWIWRVSQGIRGENGRVIFPTRTGG